jgi:NADH dehydrogenase FAD-containing subunit
VAGWCDLSPLIATLGLETERDRLKVQASLQVPGHPDVFTAGDAAVVPDFAQPGKIAPPTAATGAGRVRRCPQCRRKYRLRRAVN